MLVIQSRRRNRSQGFTLLEVLVTVVIVGVLAAIALPSYFDFITRSKIIDGTTKLSDMRSKLEKFFADNRTYPPVATCNALYVGNPATDYFTITCPATTATTYTVQATGIPARGMSGFTYTIDQTNAKTTPAVPAGWTTSATCWALRKDGSC